MTEPTRTALDHRDRSQRQNRTCDCGKPLHNSRTFCRDCEASTRRLLANQAAYLEDLQVELAKLSRKQAPAERPAGGNHPLPVDLEASRLIHRQRNWLVTWCRWLAEEGIDSHVPQDRVPMMAVHLEVNLSQLRSKDDGARLVIELRELSKAILKMIDVPENRTRVHVGPCPERYPTPDGPEDWCPGQVVAIIPADDSVPAMMECTACKAGWDTTQWNRTGHRIEQRRAALAEARRLAELMVRRTA